MCVLIFTVPFVLNTSHSKKKSARCHKSTNIFVQSTHYTCQILIKLEFSQQIFKKYSTIQFHENPSSGNPVVPRGWADMTKLTVAFCNSVNMAKNSYISYRTAL